MLKINDEFHKGTIDMMKVQVNLWEKNGLLQPALLRHQL
jgi:hypothetical protein